VQHSRLPRLGVRRRTTGENDRRTHNLKDCVAGTPPGPGDLRRQHAARVREVRLFGALGRGWGHRSGAKDVVEGGAQADGDGLVAAREAAPRPLPPPARAPPAARRWQAASSVSSNLRSWLSQRTTQRPNEEEEDFVPCKTYGFSRCLSLYSVQEVKRGLVDPTPTPRSEDSRHPTSSIVINHDPTN
jgi:hypothetical protein